MAYDFNHVHLKTPDPAGTAKFYMENFGATLVSDRPGWGMQIDLHGTLINVTPLVATQNHEQHYGIEHLAVNTDDYPGSIAALRANGVKILEELTTPDNRRICFLECPDGAQMEIIEKTAA